MSKKKEELVLVGGKIRKPHPLKKSRAGNQAFEESKRRYRTYPSQWWNAASGRWEKVKVLGGTDPGPETKES